MFYWKWKYFTSVTLSSPNSLPRHLGIMTLATLCLQQCHLPAGVSFIARIDPEFAHRNGISFCLGHDLQESHLCSFWAISRDIPFHFLQEVQEIQSGFCLWGFLHLVCPSPGWEINLLEGILDVELGTGTSLFPCDATSETQKYWSGQFLVALHQFLHCFSFQIITFKKEHSGSTKGHEESPSKII